MNEERREAYLKLIQTLLSHPRHEEQQILGANWELLDAELVQIVVQVAEDLAKKITKTMLIF